MTTALLPRGTRFGELRLTGFVGRGGFADVYEGFDPNGRRLAVKVLRLTDFDRPGQDERVGREKEVLSRVDSRGVAKLISADLSSELPWIASEFVEGLTLRSFLDSQGPLPTSLALGMIRRLAEVVAELHERGISHRDITPNNIIIGADGPVLIDFGSARIEIESESTGSLLLAGTEGFIPPEVEAGQPVGRKADVFALGMLARLCLDEQNIPEILQQAILVSPDARPQAEEIARELAGFGESPRCLETQIVKPLARKFSVATIVISVVTAVAATLGLGWQFFSSGPLESDSLLSTTGLSVETVSDRSGLLSFETGESEWEVVRKRPGDTVIGDDPYRIELIQGTRDREAQLDNDTNYDLFEASLRFTEEELGPGFQETPELADAFDVLLDRLERIVVPDGCAFQRADTPAVLADGTILVVARADRCSSRDTRIWTAGVMWRPEHLVYVEWFVSGDTESTSNEVLDSLLVDWEYKVPVVTSRASWLDLVNLAAAPIDLGPPGGTEFSGIEFAKFAVKVEPGTGVELIGSDGIDAQISAVLLSENDGYVWMPAGRWWARGSGERRIFSNPFSDPTVIVFEVEGIWDDEPIALDVQQTDGVAELLSLGSTMDSVLQDKEFEVLNSKGSTARSFTLPSNPETSVDSRTSLSEFRWNSLALGFETELLVGVVGTEEMHFVLRADETFENYEKSYLEDHDPHLLLAFAPGLEYLEMSWASDWVGVGDVGVCGNEIEWRHETVTSFVFVRAGLDCDIRDSYSFLAAGASLTPQTNPLYFFSVGSLIDGESRIVGSFAPSSSADLDRFEAFLTSLVDNVDDVVAAF